MPLYEISHLTPLSPSQKDALAASITQIHSHLFTTPSLFVNVRFTDISNQDVYVGGKKKRTNFILAHVRPGGGRSTAHFNTLTQKITDSWNHILEIREESSKEQGLNNDNTSSGLHNDSNSDSNKSLRAIFILGTIVAGREVGFELPPAGGDKAWLIENAASFRRLAEEGDEDFRELVREIGEREDLY